MDRLMSDGYPFIFQVIDKSESDEYLIQTLQYRFKSDKSHHAYIVRVECYKKHAYCVKFFDKANINSKNKFSLRSNTFEARTILYTMFHIMLDVLKRDEYASFFFIGAEDEKDQDGMVSRRFRLYRRFVLSTVSDDKFEHFRRNDLSLYILVNKRYVEDTASYAAELASIVQKMMRQPTPLAILLHEKSVFICEICGTMLKTGNILAISDISLIFAPCKVLNIRIMRTFNDNEMLHEVLEMASEYAIRESRSGRGLSHSQAMEKIKEQRGWRNHYNGDNSL